MCSIENLYFQFFRRYPEGSTTSSASTSREVSPEVPRKRITPPLPAVTGHLKLDNLKAERLKKLIKLADNRGKLIRDDDRKVIEVEKDRKDQTNGRTSSRTSVRTEVRLEIVRFAIERIFQHLNFSNLIQLHENRQEKAGRVGEVGKKEKNQRKRRKSHHLEVKLHPRSL